MAINFKTANKYLLNAVDKAPDKKKPKILKEKMKIYRSRMLTNADSFFKKDKRLAKGFAYTLDTIEKRIAKKIAQGNFDRDELQKQLNRLVTNSRNYQKQVRKNQFTENKIGRASDNSMWKYIITHPIKTEHSDECLDRQSRSPYTKDDALSEMDNLPQHINCTCTFEEIKQSKVLISQGNF